MAKKNLWDLIREKVGGAITAADDFIAPDFGGTKRTFSGNAQQIARAPQSTYNFLNDIAAPDFAGRNRTFTGNYNQVSRAIGTPVMQNQIARNHVIPFITGASRIPLGAASLVNPQAGAWYNRTRDLVTNDANTSFNLPVLGKVNPYMMAGDIALDPTSYVPIARGLSTGAKALRMAGLGASSGFLTPAETMQDRLTNTALGSTAGLLPIAGKYAKPALQRAGQGSKSAVVGLKRSLAPSADDMLNTAARRLDELGLRDTIKSDYQSRWKRGLTGSREDMRKLADDLGLPKVTQTMHTAELRYIFDNLFEGKPLPKTLSQKLEKSRSEGGFIGTRGRAGLEGLPEFVGPDDKARVIASDRAMRLKNTKATTLGEMIEHESLFRAYPELKGVKVVKKPNWPLLKEGSFDPQSRTITINSRVTGEQLQQTLAHEYQHAIQKIERFAGGADPSVVGRGAYNRSAGEIEASFVENNLRKPQSALSGRNPFTESKVPLHQQIVRFDHGNVSLRDSRSIKRASTDIEAEVGRAATPQEQNRLFNEWERALKQETLSASQLNRSKKQAFTALNKQDPLRTKGAKLPIKPNVSDRNSNFPSQALSTGGHDKASFSYQRESLLRNIEETFGRGSEQTQQVKSYLLEPIIQNETNRTKMVNQIRTQLTQRMKQADIKRSSKEDFAAADFIEGTLSEADLRARFPQKAQAIIEFAEEGRRIYKDLLTRTNEVLTRYGYDPIPERQNYVTHTTQLSTFWEEMGNFLNFDKDKLPTAISSINTQTKPGKRFNPFAQKRQGGSTHEGLATAMDKYLDITTQQMYHTADVQRARSIQNYLQRQAESAGDNTTELSNFTDYIGQYADMLAGKKSMIDRPVEKIIGRGVYKAANALRSRFGANAIAGSISSAVTNFVPLTQTLATTNKVAATKGLLENMKLGDEALIDGVESAFLRRRFPETRIGGNAKTVTRDVVTSPFSLVDKFTSKSIVAGKFYEGIQKGLDPQTAMARADEYAARAMSDRSLGQSPLLFNSQTLGLFTQFQNEVNNQLSFIGKDIPKNLGMSKAQAASALTQLAVFSYLYNEVYEKMNGRRPAIDPIDYSLNALQGNWGEVGEGVLNTVPFASSVAGAFGMETGRIPMAGGIPDLTNIANDPIKELSKPLAYFALPYGGGQIKKTVEGLSTYAQGGDFAKDGDTKFEVEGTPANLVRSAAFGKWATPEAQEYIKGIGKTKPASKEVTAGITDTDPTTRIEALKEEKKRIEKLQEPGFMREGITEDERESMLADIEKQISLAELEEKFVLKGDTSTSFGKNRQKEKFETAITDVYKSWLDGEIEEDDVERIFREQGIDPEIAEFTFVKSLDDAEVAPWVMEQYQQYGDEVIAKMIDQDVLTTSITKQMYDQDLISKDQKKYLDSLINEKTASGREANAKAKKGKKISIKINRSAGPKAPAFISMNTGSTRITPPKFRKITA